ncbi:MAG: ATP-binding cassette domain-containing protein, partial [Patescibacteria group bacterium]
LNFDDTPYQALQKVMKDTDEHKLRQVAASFLIIGDTVYTPIGRLSEGQKGLVAFAQLVLMEPGLLILDEPTNHINFRHLPVIAEALKKFEGPMVVVSHMHEFVEKIGDLQTLDLGK